jgi:hypothetical protein
MNNTDAQPNQDVSLLQVIKSGAIEASLLTTFNATLPFYEDVVLRKLVAAGSKYNLVLMDRAQCARSWETPSMRPRMAGSAYALVPMAAPGAFHPKIGILAGKKRSVFFVGSHNLTLSGFGFNREVTNWMQLDGNADSGRRFALAHAWSLVREWVSRQEEALPSALVDAVHRFGEFLPAEPRNSEGNFDIRLLGQSCEGPSLLDQLRTALPEAPRRVLVLGAFFDREHALLQAFEALWPAAKLRIVIDPETVRIGRRPRGLRSQFVNARSLWKQCEDQYLHAKALLLDFGGSWALAAGSANPSRPAWLGGQRANFEAMLLSRFTTHDAPRFALDLMQAWDASVMTEEDLKAISTTVFEGEAEEVAGSHPVVVAVLREEDGAIVLPVGVSRGLDHADVFGPEDLMLASVEPTRQSTGELLVPLGEHSSRTRWVQLTGSGSRLLRVIVHHERALQAGTGKSLRSELRDALARLEMSGSNLESLLSIIHRAVFDEDSANAYVAAGRGANGARDKSSQRPDSLGVHAGSAATRKKSRRILGDGGILDIVNALIHRIGVGLAVGPADRPRRDHATEEESIGQEEAPAENLLASPIVDDVIANAIERKLGVLVDRMCRQLERGSASEKTARTALVQLVAVLSVIRELRRLRHHPLWRYMRGFVSEKKRQKLLTTAMQSIFGSKVGFISLLVDNDGEEPVELGQARALLAWLAWDLGFQLDGPIAPFAEDKVRRDKTFTYAVLFELLPKVATYQDEVDLLLDSVRMTKKPTAEAGSRAEAWLSRHVSIGEDVATAPEDTFNDRTSLVAGDLMRLPKSTPPRLRVVLTATANEVTITELDGETTFQRRLS